MERRRREGFPNAALAASSANPIEFILDAGPHGASIRNDEDVRAIGVSISIAGADDLLAVAYDQDAIIIASLEIVFLHAVVNISCDFPGIYDRPADIAGCGFSAERRGRSRDRRKCGRQKRSLHLPLHPIFSLVEGCLKLHRPRALRRRAGGKPRDRPAPTPPRRRGLRRSPARRRSSRRRVRGWSDRPERPRARRAAPAPADR